MAFCKFCDEEIEWYDDEGKWVPLDPETNERHDCQGNARGADPYQRGYEAGYLVGHRAGVSAQTAEMGRLRADVDRLQRFFSEETIVALVRLCHPDRHPPERYAEANRLTAQLLDLRDKTRK